jgi:hypothetical protein
VAIDKVREWLNKSGFPLEMAAAAAFRSVGFDVRQSFTYADPQSVKGRGEELGLDTVLKVKLLHSELWIERCA